MSIYIFILKTISATAEPPSPLSRHSVEFDVGRNLEFNDPHNYHVGIELNNIESAETTTAVYYTPVPTI